jgi:hypothetical protein
MESIARSKASLCEICGNRTGFSPSILAFRCQNLSIIAPCSLLIQCHSYQEKQHSLGICKISGSTRPKRSTFILSFSHFTAASPHSPLLNYPASILPLRRQLGNAWKPSKQYISALMLSPRNNWSVAVSLTLPQHLKHSLGLDLYVYKINSTFCIFMVVFPGHKQNGLL